MSPQIEHHQPAVSATIAAAMFFAAVAATSNVDAAPRSRPNQIKYEYVRPKDPSHQAIYDQMKQGQALEHLQQLLSPLRLPYPLTLKVASCDGVADAWYENEVVTLCYELLAEILKTATTRDLPAGVSKADTILGPALDVFLHETGHAVFDMLQIPVLGREEDAADQFSAYIMLRLSKDEARRMILGAAYRRATDIPPLETESARDKFSDEHSLPAQRAFNVLCIAYGADKKLFSDIVEKDLLPKQRAETCEIDYDDVTFAMTTLIGPHIDKTAAKKFHEVWTRTVSARRARLNREQQ
ncbi:DUF4344 domain-containing metallopeptidase [Tardiphaga sp. 813_E8_N1_3]|uniref:DUF4344 domain-containing metallopeptidase n=1 Tax=Tardiphaga sp. 813_E8_N1_3 TaxID=3240760 RepID=UPI003F270B47